MEELEALRIRQGLTQEKAARLIHSPRSSWQNWKKGRCRMPRALKELFILKAGSYVSAVDLPVTLTAKEIRSYRRMAGLTISAAARIIHVSHTAWSDWEKGKKRMRRGLLEYFILRIRAEKKIWL